MGILERELQHERTKALDEVYLLQWCTCIYMYLTAHQQASCSCDIYDRRPCFHIVCECCGCFCID